ncbi:hypothetical protein COLU111180_00935 [Cohnella lubricantis]|uniref:O-antigen ligase domain-containing protein n=1 Tax=Cohnella lubricantis TaxID=2163172 RepID=A0A841TBU0_9BACL|nr:hypothetical protein [Cohnella lubricantis]MBB6676838.1 hypothetical protein [Cohnella lubricantis]MBP2119418.1 hypothetical protein [Cohnella lubricantis]
MDTIVNRIWQHKLLNTAIVFMLYAGMGLMIGWLVMEPGFVRLLLTAGLFLILFTIQKRSPQNAIYLLLLFLPFLGLIRRILIPVVGWNTMDPLVMLGPIFILFLTAGWFYKKYIIREAIADDTLTFKLLRWLLAVEFLQIFNPEQGSLLTGIAGVMFYMVPVFFMILSRELFDEAWLRKIFASVFVIGLMTAAYGFKQYFLGFFPFEQDWIDITGYTALQVYSLTRPISTFTNSAEYAHFLAISIVVGWVYFMRGALIYKLPVLAGVIFLFASLFVESARGPIVTALVAVFILTILSAKKMSHRVLLTVAASFCAAGLFFGMTKLDTSNDLIYHSVIGLTDPYGEHSTLKGHQDLLFNGFIEGFKNPLGHGLGSTTIAAGKFGGNLVASEADLSNMFLATGVIGGFLYLLILLMILYKAFRSAVGGSSIHLTILGLLLAETFQWLTGGHYSVVAILWIAIGYLDKSSKRIEKGGEI